MLELAYRLASSFGIAGLVWWLIPNADFWPSLVGALICSMVLMSRSYERGDNF